MKQMKYTYIFISAIVVALGVVMLIIPDMQYNVYSVIVGVVFLLLGAIKIIGYFSHDRYGLAFQFDFALGIFTIIAGILMILNISKFYKALPVVLGVYVLIDGAFRIQTAIDGQRFGLMHWWIILIPAVISCCCGFTLIIDPFTGTQSLNIFSWVCLIVAGIQDMIVTIYTVRPRKLKKN